MKLTSQIVLNCSLRDCKMIFSKQPTRNPPFCTKTWFNWDKMVCFWIELTELATCLSYQVSDCNDAQNTLHDMFCLFKCGNRTWLREKLLMSQTLYLPLFLPLIKTQNMHSSKMVKTAKPISRLLYTDKTQRGKKEKEIFTQIGFFLPQL